MNKVNDSETNISTLASATTLDASPITLLNALQPKTVPVSDNEVQINPSDSLANRDDISKHDDSFSSYRLTQHVTFLLSENRIQEAEAITASALSRDLQKRKTNKQVETSDDIAVDETLLGHLCVRGGRFKEAEQHYRKALEIHEATDSPSLVMGICNLADLLEYDGRLEEAELLRDEAFVLENESDEFDDEADGEFDDDDEDFDDGYSHYIPAWFDTLGRLQYEAFLATGAEPPSCIATAPEDLGFEGTAYAA